MFIPFRKYVKFKRRTRPICVRRYPFLFLAIPLVAGILVAEYLTFMPSRLILYSMAGLLLALIGVSRMSSEKMFYIFSFLFIFQVGVYCHRPRVRTFMPGKVYAIEGRCEEILLPDKAIISSNGIRIFTRHKDSIRFSVGDSLRFDMRLYSLASAANLHEFDYNAYLRHQNIQARGTPLSTPVRIGHSEDLYSFCHALQQRLRHKLVAVVPDSTTGNLLAALCLGDRQYLSRDTKQLFQETGTVHLLAISGLHIGAIYFLLLSVLHALGLWKREYTIVLIPLLWLITGITGLSPSACRAATILSFIIMGKAFLLDYVPLNAIAAAAFFTLLIQPELLYSVSFQMSYAAYTGIILIYPLISIKKKRIPRIVWRIYVLVAMSFSAQILTLPITAYHFHTINLNSLVFNLIAVPLTTLLLYLGVALLALPVFISSLLAWIVAWIVHVLLYTLQGFSEMTINVTDLYPTIAHVILVYAILFLMILYLATRQRRIIGMLFGSLCLFVLFNYGYAFYKQNRQELVVYNRYGHSTILLNHKGYYSLLKHTDTTFKPLPYVMANNLQPIPRHDGFIGEGIMYAHNRLQTCRQRITIVDRSCPDIPEEGILVITESRYPTEEAKNPLSISQVILDQSNTYPCIRAWEDYCRRKQIPLFKTGEGGSIVIPLRTKALKTLLP